MSAVPPVTTKTRAAPEPGAAGHITIDGTPIPFAAGQSVLDACDAAGYYIPRLCAHPDLEPAGHCRLCTCKINGRNAAACVTPAVNGMLVENSTNELNADRRTVLELLFVEGNHVCAYCVASGDCELQALAYRLDLIAPTLPYLWPTPRVDASHPDIYLDRNRCILCSRCIRASRDEDGKTLFGFQERGIALRLNVGTKEGLGATTMDVLDKAASVCPVACIVIKRDSYRVPNGERRFDKTPIGSDIEARRKAPKP